MKVVRILKSGDFDLSDIEVRQLLSSFHLDSEGCIDINEVGSLVMIHV